MNKNSMFKSKKENDLIKYIPQSQLDLLDDIYNLIQENSDYFEIFSERKIKIKNHILYYGFGFSMDHSDYTIGICPRFDNDILMFYFNENYTFYDIDNFKNYFYDIFFGSESHIDESSIFKGKEKNDLINNFHQDDISMLTKIYDYVKTKDKFFTIVNSINFHESGFLNGLLYYGFRFKHIYNSSSRPITAYYNIGMFPSKDNKLLLYDGNRSRHVLLSDFKNYFYHEGIFNEKELLESESIFKPKNNEYFKKLAEKKYPIFIKIFYELFPDDEYNLNVTNEDIDVGFLLTEKIGEYNLTFLVQQNHWHTKPIISFLDQSRISGGVGGFFTNDKLVVSVDNIKEYINNRILDFYDYNEHQLTNFKYNNRKK